MTVSGTAGIAVVNGGAGPAAIGAGRVGGGRRNLRAQAGGADWRVQSNSNNSLTVVSACPYIVCLSIYV